MSEAEEMKVTDTRASVDAPDDEPLAKSPEPTMAVGSRTGPPKATEAEVEAKKAELAEKVKAAVGELTPDKVFVVESNVFEYMGQLDDYDVTKYEQRTLGEVAFVLRKAFRIERGQNSQTGQIVTIPFGPFDILMRRMSSARQATAGEKGAYGVWRMEAAGLVAANQMPGAPPGARPAPHAGHKHGRGR